MIKILLVEDHDILRDGLKSILEEESDFFGVLEAKNGSEAIEVLLKERVDVVIMDINMPVMNGLETTKYICQNFKDVSVIALSMLNHDTYLYKMLEAGAKGYLLKSTNKEELLYAIKKVETGGTYICSEMTLSILDKPIREGFDIGNNAVHLSKTEREVLKEIADGLTNEEIATKLFKSRRTIETHRANLVLKTHSKNTAALIKFAILNGYIKD